MRVLMSSIGAALIIGLVAAGILWAVQEPVHERYATGSVRLGEPGRNLVGEDWSGNPKVEPRAPGERSISEAR